MPLGGRLAGSAVVIALALGGCAGQANENTESLLGAAGFRVEPADTAARQQFIAALPPRELVLMRRNGRPAWFYADPQFCRCLYAGGAHAYQKFEELSVRQRIAETELQAAQINSLNWYAWGPWPSGPFGPYDPWSY